MDEQTEEYMPFNECQIILIIRNSIIIMTIRNWNEDEIIFKAVNSTQHWKLATLYMYNWRPIGTAPAYEYKQGYLQLQSWVSTKWSPINSFFLH